MGEHWTLIGQKKICSGSCGVDRMLEAIPLLVPSPRVSVVFLTLFYHAALKRGCCQSISMSLDRKNALLNPFYSSGVHEKRGAVGQSFRLPQRINISYTWLS